MLFSHLRRALNRKGPLYFFPVVLPKQLGAFCWDQDYGYQEMPMTLDSNMLFMPYSFLPQYCALFGKKEVEPALTSGGTTSAKEEDVLAQIVFDQEKERMDNSDLVRNVEAQWYYSHSCSSSSLSVFFIDFHKRLVNGPGGEWPRLLGQRNSPEKSACSRTKAPLFPRAHSTGMSSQLSSILN